MHTNPFVATDAEREVADLLPIDAEPDAARRTLEEVPFWFHTFALNREHGLYTPGAARDHRYRVPVLPDDLEGQRVLDVGTFDGFYAFLAEHRGAQQVVAVDNEQYKYWVASRWEIKLKGGEGFRAIHALLNSDVAYRRTDAFELDQLGQSFDFIYCFGILHRVENPLGLLRVLRACTTSGGEVLVETYGIRAEHRDGPAIRVSEPGEVYAGDEFVYWGFSDSGLERLARLAEFSRAERLVEGQRVAIGDAVGRADQVVDVGEPPGQRLDVGHELADLASRLARDLARAAAGNPPALMEHHQPARQRHQHEDLRDAGRPDQARPLGRVAGGPGPRGRVAGVPGRSGRHPDEPADRAGLRHRRDRDARRHLRQL